MFANIVWRPQLANIPPCYVFWIQTTNRNCIFSLLLAKLANMVQDKQVGKQTPPAVGGIYGSLHKNIKVYWALAYPRVAGHSLQILVPHGGNSLRILGSDDMFLYI